MLGKLFGSKARVKILKLFLLHPQNKFYIRQIARGLKLQLNSVRRELDNLEAFGILFSRTDVGAEEAKHPDLDRKLLNKRSFVQSTGSKQEKKYYQANTDFVLYGEVRALLVKAQVLYEKDFIEKLQKAGKPKLLILTGLFVNRDKAIVDMLIVGRLNKPRVLKFIKELESELGREINFTLMDTKEFKYRRDIMDVFLYNILEGKKIVVIDEFGVSA